MAQAILSSIFSTNIITLLGTRSIRADCYTLANPFKHGFKPYTKACMVSSFASSGNTTTSMSNAVMYSYSESHCRSLQNLSLAIFLLSNSVIDL